MARDYYLHPPGALTKSGVLDVGLKCTHSCKFCYYSYLDRSDDQFRGMRHASFRSTEDCVAILDKLHQHGFIAFDVTGGEPTLHPEIVELMRHAHQDLGMSGRIITLGQFLMRRMKSGTSDRLIDDLLKAGLTNFLFSFHSADPEIFHALTGESLPKLISAMDYLDSLDFHYCTNTTVVEANYQTLPAIAREVAKHKVYIHNFIVMNAYYEWATENRAAGMQARYTAIHPYLAEAARILEGEGVGLNLRYVPLCAYPGLERHVVGVVGVRYDPYEWGNAGGHMGGTPDEAAGLVPIVEGDVEPYFAMRARSMRISDEITADSVRGANIKAFPPSCGPCAARNVCDGTDPKYLARHDASEMRPYARIEAKDTLLEDRRRYLAPFFVKRAPQTKMRDVVRPFFRPEPIPADPLVSVIITPGEPAATDRTVAAIRGQTWNAIEVLIAGDGELNATIEAAQGDLFLCLDAGDLPEPAMLATCIDAFRQDPSLAFVYVGDDSGDQSGEDYDLAQLRYRQIVPRTALYRRPVWRDVGGFRSHLGDAASWDFALTAGGRGHVGRRIEKSLIRYSGLRRGATSGSAVDDRQAMHLVLNNADLYPRELVRKALLDQQRLDLQEAG